MRWLGILIKALVKLSPHTIKILQQFKIDKFFPSLTLELCNLLRINLSMIERRIYGVKMLSREYYTQL